MYNEKIKGLNSLENIKFKQITNLSEETLILVNRIKINTMLTEVALSKTKITKAQLKILEQASKQIKLQEKKKRCAVSGAQLSAGDVLRLFKENENEDFAHNTFLLVKQN